MIPQTVAEIEEELEEEPAVEENAVFRKTARRRIFH